MEYFVIAKEFFNSATKNLEIEKINQLDWEEYIDNQLDQFTWMETTEFGKNRILHMDSIPPLLKDRVRGAYGKKMAFADPLGNEEFNLQCWFKKSTGTIEITVRDVLNKESIDILDKLTSHLESHIFSVINGVIVDDDPLNTYHITT